MEDLGGGVEYIEDYAEEYLPLAWYEQARFTVPVSLLIVIIAWIMVNKITAYIVLRSKSKLLAVKMVKQLLS